MVKAATVEADRPLVEALPAEIPSPAADGSVPPRTLTGRWLTVAAVLVALAVAAGVVLRFWTRSALWLDEALTVNIARLPLHQLPSALKRDGAPPLFYLLLHFWIRIFGTSDLEVRSLSGCLSVATLPVMWVAGRRFGGRTVAWAALVLLATAPFAVYYATEARMYALVMFIVACGFVAVDRALRRPRPGNVAAVALTTAALLYTQYWGLYLTAVGALGLLWLAWRGPPSRRRGAGMALIGVAAGCVLFVPWLPTFFYQSTHTGTPWAAPPNFAVIINAITGFTDNQATLTTAGSNQARLLALLYFGLAALGLFGLAKDRWHVEVDLRTRPEGRSAAIVVVGTLAVAVTGGILTQSAFSPRYASVVFIPLVLLVALGSLRFASPKLRAGILAVAALAGTASSVENVWTQRTQAPQIAHSLVEHAKPGDVVVFCPDQLGPSVNRLIPSHPYRLETYPKDGNPAFVDWVDYAKVASHARPGVIAHSLEKQAGPDHHLWLVWYGGYEVYGGQCGVLLTDLVNDSASSNQKVIQNPGQYYEPMNLVQFQPRR